MKGRKGDFQDIFLFSVIAFGMLLGGLFALKMFNVINDKMQASTQISVESKAVLNTVNVRLPKWIDGAFIGIYVVLMIVGILLAMQIPVSPAYFVISIIYFLLIIFISRAFQTMYTAISSNTDMLASANQLVIIPFVVDKLPIFTFFFGIAIIGVMVVRR